MESPKRAFLFHYLRLEELFGSMREKVRREFPPWVATRARYSLPPCFGVGTAFECASVITYFRYQLLFPRGRLGQTRRTAPFPSLCNAQFFLTFPLSRFAGPLGVTVVFSPSSTPPLFPSRPYLSLFPFPIILVFLAFKLPSRSPSGSQKTSPAGALAAFLRSTGV